MNINIVSTGSYLPKQIISNKDIVREISDLDEEGIVKRSGIFERRKAPDDYASSDMASIAALNAITASDVNPADIGMIIVSTTSPDMPFPSTACLVQKEIEAFNASAFDISASCSGFIYALSIAEQYIRSGYSKTILVIASEIKSRFLNKKDKGTFILFGDGAGAMILRKGDKEQGILSTHIYSDGSGNDLITLERYSHTNRNILSLSGERKNIGEFPYITMKGTSMFRIAVNKIEEGIKKELEFNKLNLSDIDYFIFHQANLRILESVSKRMHIPSKKMIITIQQFGNTSSSSIPLALDTFAKIGKFHPGNLILLASVGGGLTWGTSLIRW